MDQVDRPMALQSIGDDADLRVGELLTAASAVLV
jgi:hypothetical protein